VDSWFVIYMDNYNTVSMFNTLRAMPKYNHLVKAAVDILVEGDHQLRVFHVPGVQNKVADALSCLEFSKVLDLVPNLKIFAFIPHTWLSEKAHTFKPSRETLGIALI